MEAEERDRESRAGRYVSVHPRAFMIIDRGRKVYRKRRERCMRDLSGRPTRYCYYFSFLVFLFSIYAQCRAWPRKIPWPMPTHTQTHNKNMNMENNAIIARIALVYNRRFVFFIHPILVIRIASSCQQNQGSSLVLVLTLIHSHQLQNTRKQTDLRKKCNHIHSSPLLAANRLSFSRKPHTHTHTHPISNCQIASVLCNIGRTSVEEGRLARRRESGKVSEQRKREEEEEREREPTWQHKRERERNKNAIHIQRCIRPLIHTEGKVSTMDD